MNWSLSGRPPIDHVIFAFFNSLNDPLGTIEAGCVWTLMARQVPELALPNSGQELFHLFSRHGAGLVLDNMARSVSARTTRHFRRQIPCAIRPKVEPHDHRMMECS